MLKYSQGYDSRLRPWEFRVAIVILSWLTRFLNPTMEGCDNFGHEGASTTLSESFLSSSPAPNSYTDAVSTSNQDPTCRGKRQRWMVPSKEG